MNDQLSKIEIKIKKAKTHLYCSWY